jgi:hypothetical protein
VQGSVPLSRPRPGLTQAGRSQAWRGRGTGSPPVPPRQGSAITSASCIHRGLSHPADPYLDRVCSIVPVTVSRASSAASGRCHPVRTGVGVRPLASEPCSDRRAFSPHPHLLAIDAPITAAVAMRGNSLTVVIADGGHSAQPPRAEPAAGWPHSRLRASLLVHR